MDALHIDFFDKKTGVVTNSRLMELKILSSCSKLCMASGGTAGTYDQAIRTLSIPVPKNSTDTKDIELKKGMDAVKTKLELAHKKFAPNIDQNWMEKHDYWMMLVSEVVEQLVDGIEIRSKTESETEQGKTIYDYDLEFLFDGRSWVFCTTDHNDFSGDVRQGAYYIDGIENKAVSSTAAWVASLFGSVTMFKGLCESHERHASNTDNE